jgi:tRNA G18 (ribose-2'-O)-methylase SpoU
MIAILDNIRSVHNVGSIFRTADGAGVEKIYCCGLTPTPLDRFGRVRKDFAKVSLGAEHAVPWEHVASTLRLVNALRKKGYAIYAVEQAKNSKLYWKLWNKVPRKMVLVFGNEVHGLSSALLRRADTILELPMRGKKESLNVSVVFGIVAYHFAAAYEDTLR